MNNAQESLEIQKNTIKELKNAVDKVKSGLLVWLVTQAESKHDLDYAENLSKAIINMLFSEMPSSESEADFLINSYNQYATSKIIFENIKPNGEIKQLIRDTVHISALVNYSNAFEDGRRIEPEFFNSILREPQRVLAEYQLTTDDTLFPDIAEYIRRSQSFFEASYEKRESSTNNSTDQLCCKKDFDVGAKMVNAETVDAEIVDIGDADGIDENPMIVKSDGNKICNQVRPFIRLFAKTFDIQLFSICVWVLLYVSLPLSIYDEIQSVYIMNWIVVAIAIQLEAFVLSILGTTPGKWLLNTRVVDIKGNRPSLTTALQRSNEAYIKGLGLEVPLVNLITRMYAYNFLTNYSSTPWDQRLGLTVVHKKIGFIRSIGYITAFSIMVFYFYIG
ncbi:RDD family protein [Anoxynatronum buryatiense]|uniref:RDD family protein n=1 Tax=Anoxynatronum buryatiense TaxID=489973 RepID=A0AA45WVV8_9CLOT|nr:RDD family protein [Anoxynatronum buryatiense]SMP54060.1 RDD family protein [Anoxynatronum buryatiense]